MIKQCFLLSKVQLAGQFKVKGRKTSQIVMLTAFGILGLVVCIYSFGLAFGLGMLGMPEVIPSYAVAIVSLITLFFTMLKTNGILFAYKDYDMLMALPVKTSTVISSRFLTMYVWDLIFTALIMLPMGIGYVLFASPGILFYLVWLTGIFAVPLIPMTAAALLGALVIFIASRFRYAKALTTIISFAFVIAVLCVSFMAGELENVDINEMQIQTLGSTILKQVQGIYPPAWLFHKAAAEESLLFFILFLGVSAGWYYLFVKLLGIRYKQMNTGLMTYHTRSNYKLGQLKTSKPVAALWKKEAKRFFGCPVYVLNMGMGVVMAVLFAAACSIMGMDQLEAMMQVPGMSSILVRIYPFVIAALLCMTCTSSVSLSLEGTNLWILKSLPLENITIYKSKILWDLTLKVPAALLCAVLFVIRIPINDFWMAVMIFVIPVVYSAAGSVIGMYINIKFPRYDWTAEATIVKQSMSAMIGMFGGMIGGIIPVFFLLLLPGVNGALISLIFALIQLAGALAIYRHLKKTDF